MNLSNLKDDIDKATSKLSDVNRQLAFAGFAIIWIFNFKQDGTYKIPKELLTPAFYFLLSLSADFLHLVYRSLMLMWVRRYNEKKYGCNSTQEFDILVYLNWPTQFFFILKFILLAIGYYFLLHYLYILNFS